MKDLGPRADLHRLIDHLEDSDVAVARQVLRLLSRETIAQHEALEVWQALWRHFRLPTAD